MVTEGPSDETGPHERPIDARTLPDRVHATPAARALIAELQARYGPILFHQSGGCCDGSSPMCYAQGEFLIGERDVLLGYVAEAPIYMGADQFEAWRHTQLIIDVVPGRGGMFSLDNGTERRFLTRSRAFSGEEMCMLAGGSASRT
ncbi:MAG: DUF779 domain-containing protein [Pseudomonadota bacterium]